MSCFSQTQNIHSSMNGWWLIFSPIHFCFVHKTRLSFSVLSHSFLLLFVRYSSASSGIMMIIVISRFSFFSVPFSHFSKKAHFLFSFGKDGMIRGTPISSSFQKGGEEVPFPSFSVSLVLIQVSSSTHHHLNHQTADIKRKKRKETRKEKSGGRLGKEKEEAGNTASGLFSGFSLPLFFLSTFIAIPMCV